MVIVLDSVGCGGAADAAGSLLDLAIVMFTTRRLLARIAGDSYT